jgi:hypothetical protein
MLGITHCVPINNEKGFSGGLCMEIVPSPGIAQGTTFISQNYFLDKDVTYLITDYSPYVNIFV